MSADATAYWIVMRTTGAGWQPSAFYRHDTEESARTEAKRLARKNDGNEFTVFRSVCEIEVKPLPVEVTEHVAAIDGDVPF